MAQPRADDALKANVAEFSVSELSFAIKRTVEDAFGYVRLRGEVSGYRGPHTSGHCYFTLKDEKARIDAVIWKGIFGRLKIRPEEGMEVIATGRVSTYPGSSKYQIVIESLEPAGIGALLAQLEKLKKKLAAEGLFDEERKTPRPFLPGVVGVVTSPTGAVIRDMLHGFTERFPVHVVVWPVRVQGETCGAEVAAAIRGFNALGEGAPVPRPDVLIVARGGGSLEDLWGFNDEAVARATAGSAIPVIAAVGHETDWTLIDLAADARAPTPTKAAEWAVPVHADLLERVGDSRRRLAVALRRGLEERRSALKAAMRGLPKRGDLLALPRQRFDAAAGRLPRALLANTRTHATSLASVSARLRPSVLAQRARYARERVRRFDERAPRALKIYVEKRRGNLDRCTQLLASLSHRSVLERGFALVRDEAGGMVRRAESVAAGDRLELEFADARVSTTAGGKSPATPPDKSGKKVEKSDRRPARDSQGSLF